MVRSGPHAKVTNVLRVQGNGLTPNLVELVLSQDNLGGVDGRREDAKLSLTAHGQLGATVLALRSCCSLLVLLLLWSLRNDKGGSAVEARHGKSIHIHSGCGEEESKEERLEELHVGGVE